MAIDTSMYANALSPVKSVQDYDNERMTAQGNALSLQLGRQKADEYTRGIADQNNLRQVVSQFGDDKAANYNALLRAGRMTEAGAYQKTNAENGKVQGEVAKQQSDLIDAKLKQSRSYLDDVTTPEQFIAWHEGNHADPVLGPALAQRGVTAAQSRATIMESISKPGGFEDLLAKSKLGIEKYTELNKPTIHVQNLGGSSQVISAPGMGGAPTVMSNTPITQSADNVANNATTVRGQNIVAGTANARLAFDKEQARTGDDALMDPIAIRMTAQQYLAGDSGALSNFGRGAQGAANLNAVRLEVARQANAAGMSGADIAAKMAEFGGAKAGQRTAGTRSASIEIAASEAAELAPLAIEASRKVSRSGFLPFGKVQVMFDQSTNDPALRQFAMANTALSNAYSQVMSRGGVATVSDKEHARELLLTAHDQPSYEAAVAQMTREIQAAQKAPGTVKKAISAGVTGKGGHDAAPAIPSGWSVKEH